MLGGCWAPKFCCDPKSTPRNTPTQPPSMPTDQKLADTWLEALSVGSLQGCGHMRLLIDQVGLGLGLARAWRTKTKPLREGCASQACLCGASPPLHAPRCPAAFVGQPPPQTEDQSPTRISPTPPQPRSTRTLA